MKTLDVKSVKVSKKENDLDSISWHSIEQMFRQHFIKSELLIVVCSGEIIIPARHERDQLIKQFFRHPFAWNFHPRPHAH